MTIVELPLRGAGGEPVDFWRTINGHGVGDLRPLHVPESGNALHATLALPSGGARRLVATEARPGIVTINVAGAPLSNLEREQIANAVSWLLRLDADLSGFYALVASDPELGWAARGAGRMTRSQSVFEDVIKTICTTNCAWSATVRMVNALVATLGQPAPDAPAEGPEGRAFPTPEVMAAQSDAFYREMIRAGYRGPYMREIAARVAAGDLDLDALATATPVELPDDQLAKQLQALPGVGPYAAAHIMMMLGRTSPLVLDSWTRPTYARAIGSLEPVPDAEIQARFARYGEWAGLAFWLTVTRSWGNEA